MTSTAEYAIAKRSIGPLTAMGLGAALAMAMTADIVPLGSRTVSRYGPVEKPARAMTKADAKAKRMRHLQRTARRARRRVG
jgi:hypothetical protein